MHLVGGGTGKRRLLLPLRLPIQMHTVARITLSKPVPWGCISSQNLQWLPVSEWMCISYHSLKSPRWRAHPSPCPHKTMSFPQNPFALWLSHINLAASGATSMLLPPGLCSSLCPDGLFSNTLRFTPSLFQEAYPDPHQSPCRNSLPLHANFS